MMRSHVLLLIPFVLFPTTAWAAEPTATSLAAHPAAWIALVLIAGFRILCCFVEGDGIILACEEEPQSP